MSLLINALEQGLVYGIMALGVLITFRVLDFPESVLGRAHGYEYALALIVDRGLHSALRQRSREGRSSAPLQQGFALEWLRFSKKSSRRHIGFIWLESHRAKSSSLTCPEARSSIIRTPSTGGGGKE